MCLLDYLWLPPLLEEEDNQLQGIPSRSLRIQPYSYPHPHEESKVFILKAGELPSVSA